MHIFDSSFRPLWPLAASPFHTGLATPQTAENKPCGEKKERFSARWLWKELRNQPWEVAGEAREKGVGMNVCLREGRPQKPQSRWTLPALQIQAGILVLCFHSFYSDHQLLFDMWMFTVRGVWSPGLVSSAPVLANSRTFNSWVQYQSGGRMSFCYIEVMQGLSVVAELCSVYVEKREKETILKTSEVLWLMSC